MKHFLLLIAALGSLWAGNPCGADVTPAEQRLSTELKKVITDGSVVLLGPPEQGFLGIFSQAQVKKSKGGIILLHDLNAHADWPEVISPLRRNLTHYGWHTLSIQLPLKSAAVTYNSTQWENLELETHRRIQIAIEYCLKQRIFNLVLLGHQFGALMAGKFVAKHPGNKAISAVVALNLYSPANHPWNTPKANQDLATSIKIAFLDIVPSQSPNYVVQLAAKRKAAMKKLGNDKYRQINIIGSDYTFRGTEQSLTTRIQAWLSKLAPSMEVQIPPLATQPADGQGAQRASPPGE